MEWTFRLALFAALLGSFCMGVEISKRVAAKQHDNVTLHWNRQVEGGDKINLGSNVEIVSVTFSGRLSVPANRSERVTAALGPGMSHLNVTLLDVNASSAGVYTLSNDGNEELEKQLLIILAKPAKPNITVTSGPFLVGHEKSLTCQTQSNSLPANHGLPMTFTWSVTPPGGRQEGGRYLVTVPPQQRRQSFNFSCQAREEGLLSESSDVLSLCPEYGPLEAEVSSSPAASSQGEVPVREGQQLALSCSADCRPGCVVQWRNRDGEVVKEGRESATFNVTAGRTHYGAYDCFINNTFGNVTSHSSVDVLYDASIISLSVNGERKSERDISHTTAENSTVSFGLEVDSNPQPSASYYVRAWGGGGYGAPTDIPLQGQEKESLGTRQLHLYKGDWTIPRAGCSHTGEYLMEAKQPQQGSRASNVHVNLSVTCSPRPTNPPTQKFGVALDSTQTVEVNLTAFPRDLTFTLLLDNVPVSPQPRLKTMPLPEPWKMAVAFNVTIEDQSDYGTYQARFRNSVGNMTSTFEVTARGRPRPVENVNVTSVTSSSITLAWTPGFDGGLPQTFSVEHRPHGEEQWTLSVERIQDKIFTVANLEADTMYHIRVLAVNEMGRAEAVEVEATTVSPGSPLDTTIAIVVVISVIISVIVIIIVTVLVVRKHRRTPQDKEKEVHVGLMANPGVSAATPSEEAVYSAVVKKPKKKKESEKRVEEESAAPVYGVVRKPKKSQPSETIYENAGELMAARKQNEGKAEKQAPNGKDAGLPDSRHVNDDGLIYVDVEISAAPGSKPRIQPQPQPQTQPQPQQNNNKQETEYVTIDFSKQAPVIVESDSEEEGAKK